jgi:hypothetical protein
VKGPWIVQASWAGTAAFASTAGLAAVFSGAGIVALSVALALFVAGCAAFAAAYARAVGRSRVEEISVLELFLLAGAAPAGVRRHLLGAVVVQVVVALASAGVRPNTSLAFGILVPVYGLGLAGLWGARHGTFPPRRRKSGPPARR